MYDALNISLINTNNFSFFSVIVLSGTRKSTPSCNTPARSKIPNRGKMQSSM